MHQDFKDDKTCEALGNEHVCELFNFVFELSIKPDPKTEGDERLVLSQDTKKLMVIFKNKNFCIYTRGEPSADKKVIWEADPERQFIKFPSLLQAEMKTNFLFDPTFTYMIDSNYKEGCFVIYKTTGDLVRMIPSDLISVRGKNQKRQSAELVKKKASRMFFRTESIIEYIGTDGLWVMMNIEDMSVKRYSQIKNWLDRDVVQDHAMLQPVVHKYNEVFKRILRQG